MMKQMTIWLTTLCLLFCGAALNAAERNIIFVVTDDEGQTLGCYGAPVAVTPSIDALAKDGAMFSQFVRRLSGLVGGRG